MKRVLYICHYAQLYGANKSLLNIIDGLRDNFEPFVLLPHHGTIEPELQQRNVKYFILSYKIITFLKYNSKLNFLLFYPRALYVWLINNYVKYKIKKIVLENSIDIIHSNSGIINIGYIVSKMTKKKHVWHLREFQDLDYGLVLEMPRLCYLRQLKQSDIVIAISHAIAEHFKVQGKAQIIYNGILKKENLFYSLDYNQKNDPYFLFCGLIFKNKGIEEAIQGFICFAKNNPSFQLLIVGQCNDMKYFSHLRTIVAETDGFIANRIHFLGYRTDIAMLMKNATALLMCSKSEAMGRVTIEAMALSCPVIGYASGATKELILNNKTGLLYSTISEMVDQMNLIVNNNLLRKQIIHDAYQYASENFTEKEYAQIITNIYNL
jgi:glycosyltransferase involved in cell wall biosynthesis